MSVAAWRPCLFQGQAKVFDQIVRVFDSAAHAQEFVRDSQPKPFFEN